MLWQLHSDCLKLINMDTGVSKIVRMIVAPAYILNMLYCGVQMSFSSFSVWAYAFRQSRWRKERRNAYPHTERREKGSWSLQYHIWISHTVCTALNWSLQCLRARSWAVLWRWLRRPKPAVTNPVKQGHERQLLCVPLVAWLADIDSIR